MKKISKLEALMTAIGIMIGVGIYFKADNILIASSNNFYLSMIVWSVICLGLTISAIAVSAVCKNVNPNGGMIGFIEEIFGKKLSFLVGWFQTIIYVPVMCAVLGNVVISYFAKILNISFTPLQTLFLTLLLIIFVWIWNAISVNLATKISVTATYIKIIPLIFICIFALFNGNVDNINNLNSQQTFDHSMFLAFLAPCVSIAFMFDGWIGVSSLAVDMKEPKKDLPVIIPLSVFLVSVIYILYYVAVNFLIDSNLIITEGDNYLYLISEMLLGNIGAKIIILFVIISGIGTLNAIFMVGNRYIEKLANEDLIFKANFFRRRTKNNTLVNASVLTIILIVIVSIILYLQQIEFKIFNIEIFGDLLLEDAVVSLSTMFTTFIYIICFKLYKERKINLFTGIIAPTIGIIINLLIFISFLISTENVFIAFGSIIIISVIISLGFLINKKKLFRRNYE